MQVSGLIFVAALLVLASAASLHQLGELSDKLKHVIDEV